MPHYIKTCLALACLALICGCTIWPQKPAAWSNATGAEQFERLWWQDVKDKNWSEVEQRLSGAADGGDRRAQLVAGVGDEVAPHALQPLLFSQVAEDDQRPAIGEWRQGREEKLVERYDVELAANGRAGDGARVRA